MPKDYPVIFLGRFEPTVSVSRPHAYIIGMEVADSEALLDRLWAHAADPRFAVSHQWRVADTLIWNNLGILHRRDRARSGRWRAIEVSLGLGVLPDEEEPAADGESKNGNEKDEDAAWVHMGSLQRRGRRRAGKTPARAAFSESTKLSSPTASAV